MIHEFDPVLYPIRLWVSITNDLTEVRGRFVYLGTTDEFDYKMTPKVGAFMQMVTSKETGFMGALVVFKDKKYCTTKLIAHEATHVSREIWEHLNEIKTGFEADAYLVGWVAECIEKVKRNKINK